LKPIKPVTVLPEMLVLVGATRNAPPFIDTKYFDNTVKKSPDSLYCYYYYIIINIIVTKADLCASIRTKAPKFLAHTTYAFLINGESNSVGPQCEKQ
jgi:hypothetical protein